MFYNILFVAGIIAFVWLMWWVSKKWDESTDRDCAKNDAQLKLEHDIALVNALYKNNKGGK